MIKEQVIKIALPMLINILVKMITSENVKKYTDKLFDLAEEFIADTATPIDNAMLPVIQALRAALQVPDND